MGEGVGHGKVILFGEHFVVHGAPAIAAGIRNFVKVEVSPARENRMITDHKVVPEMSLRGISYVLSSMDVHDKYDVRMEGDLPTFGGLGSSAAFCVALVRAVAEERGMSLTPQQVNAHAYEGEKAFHGNPSGIDNVLATHRGVMAFRRGKTALENRYERIAIGKPLDLVVAFSGKYGPTSKMVESVRIFKEQDPDGFAQLMDEYMLIEAEARKFIEKGKHDEIGRLMNANQALLSELGVSDESNEEIVGICRDEGALGAKLTGGGGGGCVIALAKDPEGAERLLSRLEKGLYQCFLTRIADPKE